jgi:integrase
MINRENWQLTRKYLDYRQSMRQRRPNTLAADKSHLKHLLEWADSTSIFRAHTIKPGFLAYQDSLGLPKDRQARIGITARGFFQWLQAMYPRRTLSLDGLWLESLMPRLGEDMVAHQDPYSLEEIQLLCQLSPTSLTMQRTQAAVALMFCGGIRPGALVTLPIECVDLAAGELRQWPDCGVSTKKQKRATTYLLNLPDLLEVASKWDALVRHTLVPSDAWYAYVSKDGTSIIGGPATRNRPPSLALALRTLCKAAGVRYRRPHDIRHGHASYALTLCTDMADYKAVSKNMMHANVITTDQVYASIGAAEIKRRIESLGGTS